MKLDRFNFAEAAAITAGVAYLLGALFVAIAPDLAIQILGSTITHIVSANKFVGAITVTWASAFMGFVRVAAYTFIGAWVLALVYDMLLARETSTAAKMREEWSYGHF
jgi:hypothetical protein